MRLRVSDSPVLYQLHADYYETMKLGDSKRAPTVWAKPFPDVCTERWSEALASHVKKCESLHENIDRRVTRTFCHRLQVSLSDLIVTSSLVVVVEA